MREPTTSTPTLYTLIGKSTFDRTVAAIILAAASPLFAAVALGVRLSLGRGVLYRQQRTGLHGAPFTVLKFRSMKHCRRSRNVSPPVERRVTHKSATDPRITPFGAFIRRWSLDELPQLINVVRGELSLVGPRPELVEITERYEPWQRRRHDVKPGITGLWQVSERDADGCMHEHVDIDLRYVDSLTLRQDLLILCKTLPAVLRGPSSAPAPAPAPDLRPAVAVAITPEEVAPRLTPKVVSMASTR